MIKLKSISNFKDELDNSITCGENVLLNNFEVRLRDKNSKLTIGSNVRFDSGAIEMATNSTLEIGSNVHIRGQIFVGWGCHVKIGSNFTVTNNLTLKAGEHANITIGDDCLFASDIVIRSTDGHPIYDARTKKRLNDAAPVTIGNHVWIADECLIFKGCIIGDASIVAARSIVTKQFGPNSLIAGSPAKVIKEGVTWERRIGEMTESYYLTDNVQSPIQR
jgi:acetyltransferase-like isoleucine patch superfamily enzyme